MVDGFAAKVCLMDMNELAVLGGYARTMTEPPGQSRSTLHTLRGEMMSSRPPVEAIESTHGRRDGGSLVR